MIQTFDILFTNKTNGTIYILDPWYTSVAHKSHLNVQSTDMTKSGN